MSLRPKMKFYCDKCNYSTLYMSHYAKHLDTKKHKNKVDFTKNARVSYRCELCDYNTCNKYDFNIHKNTPKHKKYLEISQNQEKISQNSKMEISDKTEKTEKTEKTDKYMCECGKQYKHRQSLHTHKKKCKFSEQKQEIEKQLEAKMEEKMEAKMEAKMEEKMTAELDKRMNQQMEMYTEIIKNEVIPNMQQSAITNINNTTNNNTTNNNTNNFNLNIFLNETCKDAINITEFIENLKIGLQELEFVKDNGIVKGISNVFVNELNALDVDKRPIHCTDAKRKTLYIKDDDKWDKENKATNEKIDRSIQHVKKKHVDSIKEWEEKNPNWCDDEKLAMEYLRMVRNSTTPIDKTGEKRIISEVAAEVDISDIKNKND